MVVSQVCSSVDAIRAFLQHLVDPMLPQEPSIHDDPPLSQQQKIANQVHSVVLLYNYYHRKQNPEAAFVAFREFCKLIVDMRPALLPYMKFTAKPNETDLVDVEEQLSLTEKAITSSYDICTILDPSKSVPNVEGWPISKVAVLLVDGKKENCYLRFCSATGGVWSLIEKDVDTSGQISEVTRDVKCTYQKRRVIKKPSKDGLNEGRILEVGYSAVKEAAGVNSIDITLLKSYTVYSQSKEKTASRFYIMKCSKLISEGFVQVPIKDLVKSFRGPLVKRSSSSWKVTPVVKHFHVLPYSKIISEWISSETFSNGLQDSKPAEKQLLTCGVTESCVSSEGMSFGLDNKPCSDTIEALNQKETNGFCSNTRCGTVKKDQDMDMNNSLRFHSKIEEECQQHIGNTLQVSEDKKIENPSTQHHSNECTHPSEVEKFVSTRLRITQTGIKDNISESIEKCTLIANNSDADLEKVQICIDSKGKMAVTDACPTVDAVRAFLEHLVDPMLQAKPSTRDDPPLSQQQRVAKQVHSVVLLYNYYHRKQHPELAFVAFKEFCKLAVDLSPALLTYMKFTQKPNETDLVDVEQQLSLTERVIMSSCDICTCLDASKSIPNIEGWPVSKVAVLLVDSKKEICFLLFSSITDGVWSVIEKDTDSSDQNSTVTNGIKHAYKKRRVIKKPTKHALNVNEDGFLQIGYSSVKEVTGVNSIDIMLLGSYTVYSQSKEKTASRFYIMKCSQSTDEGFIQVPIKHLIQRETFSNSLQDSMLIDKQFPKLEVTKLYGSSEGISIGLDNKPCTDTIEAINQKDNNGCGTIKQCGSVKEAKDMELDNSIVFPSKNKESKHIVKTLHAGGNQKILNPSVQHHSNGTIEAINQQENNGCGKIKRRGSVKEAEDMEVDNSIVFPSKSKEESKHIVKTVHATEDQKILNPSVQHHSNGTIEAINQKENNGCGTITRCGSVKEAKDMDVDNSIVFPSKFKESKHIVKTLHAIEDQKILNPSVQHHPNDTIKALNQKENNCYGTIKRCGSFKEAKDMDVDNSIVFPSKFKEESKHIVKTLHASEYQKILNPSVQHHSNECTSPHEAKKVVSTRTHITEGGIKGTSAFDKICANTTSENESVEKCTPIENNSNTDLEKFRNFIASKGKILSETAIKVLIRKRNALTLQKRMIEDSIAVCNMKIQRWLIGEEDDMELKIESIIDGCNGTCLRNQGRTSQYLEGHQCLLPSVNRKRLADAVLSLQTPCQELDDICHVNNWILPTYKLSQSDGKFQANVRVKGLDFENSCEGNPCSFPHEARDSAAAQMLTNLRSMAKSAI
ncbi:uncharacterized protein LOC127087266 isoform X3 [Lathyrus oleraceus]|nr:uncharacterized protein LOC127087266 isoform X3 [Pisum sativum]